MNNWIVNNCKKEQTEEFFLITQYITMQCNIQGSMTNEIVNPLEKSKPSPIASDSPYRHHSIHVFVSVR